MYSFVLYFTVFTSYIFILYRDKLLILIVFLLGQKQGVKRYVLTFVSLSHTETTEEDPQYQSLHGITGYELKCIMYRSLCSKLIYQVSKQSRIENLNLTEEYVKNSTQFKKKQLLFPVLCFLTSILTLRR